MSLRVKGSILNNSQYVAFGVFTFIFVISTMYSMPIASQYNDLLRKMYCSILIISTCFVTYPIWGCQKIQKIVDVAWYVSIFYALIFVGGIFVILSDASNLQVIMFMLNIFVMSILLSWKLAIVMLCGGIVSSTYLCKQYLDVGFLFSDHNNLKLKLIYITLFIGTTLIIFTKPKQAKEKLDQDLKNHINSTNKKYESKFIKLFQYRQDFVNRIDKECIKIFKTIHLQSKEILDTLLLSPNDKSMLIDNAKELTQITERLRYASEYLLEIIYDVKDKVCIRLEQINLEDFLIAAIGEFQKLYSQEADIRLKLNTKIQAVELDSKLIKKVINHFLHTVLSAKNDKSITVFVDDDEILFRVSLPNEECTLITTKAISFNIAEDNIVANWLLIEKIDQIDIKDIDFIECYNVVSAHYGNVKYSHENNVGYSFSIPTKIREIRPKIMDLPDIKLEDLGTISSLFMYEKREILRSIANELYNKGMAIDYIVEVLKIEEKEVISLING